MKILVVVRKLDKQDHLAGFMYGWIKAIAQNVEELKVICLEMGDVSGLPDNVEVASLRKSNHTSPRLRGASRLKEFFKYRAYLKQFLPQVDAALIFQNPIYATIAGKFIKERNFFSRFFRDKGKRGDSRYFVPLIMWYAHGAVGRDLKRAAGHIDLFLTSSSKGFRLKTSQPVKVIGQAIDTSRFTPNNKLQAPNHKQGGFKLISIGRMSPVKDYETLIEAAGNLVRNHKDLPPASPAGGQSPPYKGGELVVNIIGAPGLPEQEEYWSSLKSKVRSMKLENYVNFLGAVPNTKIIEHLQKSDIFVNTSNTGSMDKAVLEAMSAGLITISCNEAYKEMLSKIDKNLFFNSSDAQDLVNKIDAIMNMSQEKRSKISQESRKEVVEHHSLEKWAEKVINNIKELIKSPS